MNKVIVLLSGGLDSTLAAKMMIDQGLEVIGFNMTSLFCTCTPKKSGCPSLAKNMADQLGVRVVIKAKGEDYLEIIRKPQFGHGKGLNPCIDCRIYTFKKAKELMEETGALAIVTGEVLGQRPMSQRRDAMNTIEKESGLEGKVLRPLSAAHLPETEIEKSGIVDRSKLLAISGRGRHQQMQMAEDAGLLGISCGTGGCLLTDKKMKAKLLDLFAHKDTVILSDIPRLKIGRHFRLENGLKFILGRDFVENEFLRGQRKSGETYVEPLEFTGPGALVEASANKIEKSFVGNTLRSFSKLETESSFPLSFQDDSGTRNYEIPFEPVDFRKHWIGQD